MAAHSGIWSRGILVAFVPLILLAGLQGTNSVLSQRALRRRALEEKLAVAAQVVVGRGVSDVASPTGEDLLGRLARDPDFARAAIVASDGSPIACRGRCDGARAAGGDDGLLTARIALRDGTLTLAYSRARATAAQRVALARVLAMASLSVALMITLVMLLRRDRRAATASLATALDVVERANVAKSEFLANMSHEIRTPMTAIHGYADLLLDPDVTLDQQQDYVRSIRANGDHLLTLINDILDLSKIEAGKMELERIECELPSLLADVMAVMRVRATEKQLDLAVQIATPIPSRVITDPTRLRQVLINLVGNAIKFTEKGGARIVVGRRSEERLSFAVIDTGIGLDEEQRGRLFLPFSQADTSTTRRFGGSGLGLAISRRLARMLGGELECRSQLGVGSTFELTLVAPAAPGASPIEHLEETLVVLPAKRGRRPRLAEGTRVLVVDDGPDNQLLMATYLRKSGAEAVCVDNGRAAVDEALKELAAGRPYDVILMDMQMPVLDGYGATALLRKRGYERPIVAVTAHSMAGDRERCRASGCDDFLTKPIDVNGLIGAVAHWSDRGQSPFSVERRSHASIAPVPAATGDGPLCSTYADDPDMTELIQSFVGELPTRMAKLEEAIAGGDRAQLETLAHQLKGAAGGYGFGSITVAAGELERQIKSGATALREPLDALLALCARATRPSAPAGRDDAKAPPPPDPPPPGPSTRA